MKASISKDEIYPCFSIYLELELGEVEIEIEEKLLEKYLQAMKNYNQLQNELEELYEQTIKSQKK